MLHVYPENILLLILCYTNLLQMQIYLWLLPLQTGMALGNCHSHVTDAQLEPHDKAPVVASSAQSDAGKHAEDGQQQPQRQKEDGRHQVDA
jgi:hypothetical protein